MALLSDIHASSIHPSLLGFGQNRSLPVVVKNLIVARTLLFSAVGLMVLVLLLVVEVVVLVVLVVPNSLSWMRDILRGPRTQFAILQGEYIME